MKTISAVLLSVLLLALPASGEVVVYKKSQAVSFIGLETSFRVAAGGYFVIDSNTRTGFNITSYVFGGQKNFTVEPVEENVRYYSVTGRVARVYSVSVGSVITNKAASFQDRTQFSIGAVSRIPITPTNVVNMPRVLTFSGNGVIVPTGGTDGLVAQGKGAASYSATESRRALVEGETVATTVDRLKEFLASRGFTETAPL